MYSIKIINYLTEKKIKKILKKWKLLHDPTSSISLTFKNNHIFLNIKNSLKLKNFYIDFLNKSMTYRKKYGGQYKETLVKAIGLKPQYSVKIIDATAGFGKESFLLASLGARVTMIEKNPVIALLLNDALKRAKNDTQNSHWIQKRLKLIHICHSKYFKENNLTSHIIYLDPMYENKKKKSKPKKNIQIIQKLVEKEKNYKTIKLLKLKQISKKIVVKRKKELNYLNCQKPNYSIFSKKYRFDIYKK